MAQMLEILVISKDDEELHRDLMLQARDVIECCKSLTVHDTSQDVLLLSHNTVSEFLGSLESQLEPTSQLAQCCLTYLGFKVFDGNEVLTEGIASTYRFGSYALSNWAFCARGGNEESPEVLKAIFRTFGSEKRIRLIFEDRGLWRHIYANVGDVPILRIASRHCGLNQVRATFKFHLERCEDSRFTIIVESTAITHKTQPLTIAVRYGNEDFVRTLLEAGADVNWGTGSDSALWQAVEHGQRNMVKTLREAGATIESGSVGKAIVNRDADIVSFFCNTVWM
jgi:hypothetical protein